MLWYSGLALIRETAPQVGIISVACKAYGLVVLRVSEDGLHVLLETPIVHVGERHARFQKTNLLDHAGNGD